jgi:hypothetical protein
MSLTFSVFVSMIMAVLGPQTNQLAKPYSVFLHPPNGTLQSTSEIRLGVTITNVTDRDIVFARSPGAPPEEETTYSIDIRGTNDRRPPRTDFFRELTEKKSYGGSQVRYVLGPGESMEDVVVLTRLYVLKSGEYKVTVERGIRPLWQDPKQKMISSNTIKIKIEN